MSWKTIATFVTDAAADAAALDAATALAERLDAHLDITCLGIDPTNPETWLSGTHTLAVALPATLVDAERSAEELSDFVRKRMQQAECRWSTRPMLTHLVGVNLMVSEEARFADLVVAGRPYGPGKGQAQVSVVEASLFGGRVPVLVTPTAHLPARFARVAVGWNDSPEALRAVRAALPVIAAADAVDVIIVDPPKHGSDRSDPGGSLAQMLSRHGARPEVRVLARSQTSLADLLVRQVREIGADLLVMGAYGHSRLRESILGGATRDMLGATEIPVLMMH